MSIDVNDFMKKVREDVEDLFPNATSIKIFINAYEVNVTPNYTGELTEASMQTIDGNWCSKREE